MSKELDYIADLERENRLVKSFLYCTTKSCNNCGKVNCENFQRQRTKYCENWVSYKDYIKELEQENAELRKNGFTVSAMTEQQLKVAIEKGERLEKENAELKDEVRKLKLLVSSLVYEINQIWDINEMNDDLRMCAEKIDREVQLSKMAEDNRMVISALGFAIVPPKPKLDVKET